MNMKNIKVTALSLALAVTSMASPAANAAGQLSVKVERILTPSSAEVSFEGMKGTKTVFFSHILSLSNESCTRKKNTLLQWLGIEPEYKSQKHRLSCEILKPFEGAPATLVVEKDSPPNVLGTLYVGPVNVSEMLVQRGAAMPTRWGLMKRADLYNAFMDTRLKPIQAKTEEYPLWPSYKEIKHFMQTADHR